MTTPTQNQNEELTFSCRFHPTDWFHEVGCPHMEWSKEQLFDALMTKKKSEKMGQDAMIEMFKAKDSAHSLAMEEMERKIEKYKDALIWCSASKDFQVGGQAREGWGKIAKELL